MRRCCFNTFLTFCYRLKGKINAPPANPDAQDIPRSLQNFIKLKESVGKVKKKLKKPKHQFTQGNGETDGHFIHRVSQACNFRIQENMFENKYSVEIKRNEKTGEVGEASV